MLWGQETQKPVFHTVEKGNTIYSLSRQYKVSVLDIKTWNDMKSNNLSVGDKIIVGYREFEETSDLEEKSKVAGEYIPDDEPEQKTEKIDPEKIDSGKITMEPRADEKNTPPASLEDLGTDIDDENIYNISLETVEETKGTESKDLSKSMALPKPTSLVFCGGVNNGVPVGVSTVFYKQASSNYFYVFLEIQEQFDDSELIVELYQKEDFSKRFNNHKRTQKFAIKARWKYTSFRYEIPEPGEYRMMVFNSQKKKLAEGFFVILEK